MIKEALSVLDDNLGRDEKQELVDALNMKDDEVLKWRVKWQDMKPELKYIGRGDLIEEIKMKTDITAGKKGILSIYLGGYFQYLRKSKLYELHFL